MSPAMALSLSKEGSSALSDAPRDLNALALLWKQQRGDRRHREVPVTVSVVTRSRRGRYRARTKRERARLRGSMEEAGFAAVIQSVSCVTTDEKEGDHRQGAVWWWNGIGCSSS